MRLYGVDGCSTGWLVASADVNENVLDLQMQQTLEPLVRLAAAGQALVVVDVPIGLPDHVPRACDVEARAFCFPRHNSVFPAPSRATLVATTYADACRLNFEACGKKITKQLFGILPKIAAVDRLITPALQERIREAHSEVSFAALAGSGRGMSHYKKSRDGERERIGLLHGFFGPIDVEGILSRFGLRRAGVARDDIIDALACLATARRISTFSAITLPRAQVRRDSRGLRMEIVG